MTVYRAMTDKYRGARKKIPGWTPLVRKVPNISQGSVATRWWDVVVYFQHSFGSKTKVITLLLSVTVKRSLIICSTVYNGTSC